MPTRTVFDKTELHLVRVFHTVISESSVSRAALRLAMTQPAVSAQLRRLRELIGDPLLVRSGTGMVPTEVALQLLEPAATLLRSAEQLFGGKVSARAFDPAAAEVEFRIAASDYLDPTFLPALVTRLRLQAPRARLTVHALSADFDYRARLARGELDLAIGNWLEPPDELHLGRLFTDEVVCLVAADHPARREPQRWTVQRYLECDHVAPTPLHAGAAGVIDEHLARQGLVRHIVVRSPHFALVPAMLARSHLVLTTGRQFCRRHVELAEQLSAQGTGQPKLAILPCPVHFPPMVYFQLWHEVSHAAASLRWLRELVRDVARGLAVPAGGAAGGPAGAVLAEGGA
ncbi:MAG: LysR family transcriptional regulator [Burkholderiales bacterium]|jgi:DNA-binding transcriptional LysR family regulator|nr:LysR family transcriptional regulator [Burkholderiales bacterium]MBP6250057.1 LysR family transcriptional regulator [Leptothrix sp. (in: b-proteobacteria)]MBP7522453.1 LysR family transcriptional regulator [Leptothrix sp. (in: b-proteobacteria)]